MQRRGAGKAVGPRGGGGGGGREEYQAKGDQPLVYVAKVSRRKNTVIPGEEQQRGGRAREGKYENKQIKVAVARPELLVWRGEE